MSHGLMFHHFFDGNSQNAVGAVSPEQLEEVIATYGLDNILPAAEWFEQATNDNLKDNQVCITLDDSLRSQVELALPVLEKYGLTAFWFIYSSVFEEQGSKFEIFRHFSTTCFESFDQFFDTFMDQVKKNERSSVFTKGRQAFIDSRYLKEYIFYSNKEREYRYFRDKILGREKFETLMEGMVAECGLSCDDLSKGLWMDNNDLLDLTKKDHIIGLHSYSHPTELSSLSYVDQRGEYQKNIKHIEKVTGRRPKVVAHPVNSYGPGTLQILGAMGIEIGFRSNMFKVDFCPLEYPREDCANIIKNNSARSQTVGVNQCL